MSIGPILALTYANWPETQTRYFPAYVGHFASSISLVHVSCISGCCDRLLKVVWHLFVIRGHRAINVLERRHLAQLGEVLHYNGKRKMFRTHHRSRFINHWWSTYKKHQPVVALPECDRAEVLSRFLQPLLTLCTMLYQHSDFVDQVSTKRTAEALASAPLRWLTCYRLHTTSAVL